MSISLFPDALALFPVFLRDRRQDPRDVPAMNVAKRCGELLSPEALAVKPAPSSDNLKFKSVRLSSCIVRSENVQVRLSSRSV